jgi:hypothetical protein
MAKEEIKNEYEDVCLSCKNPEYVFVFGSNNLGKHGRGAALHAVKFHGAIKGIHFGMQGNSFAIPTKDGGTWTPLPLPTIEEYVKHFLNFAKNRKDLKFFATRIGCGLSNYRDIDIAPFFVNSPENVTLPEKWRVK